MAAFDDIAKKATDFLNSEKTKNALRSEKAEEVSDKLLDGVAGFANKITGGKHEDKIADLRAKADDKVGTEGDGNTPGTHDSDGTGTGTGTVGPDGTRLPG